MFDRIGEGYVQDLGPDLVHDEEDIGRFVEDIREPVAEDRPGVRTVEATLETAHGETLPSNIKP